MDGARGLLRAQGSRVASALLQGALLATLLASALAWFAADWWFADLASHFRLQYLVAAAVLVLVFIWLRQVRWLLAGLVTLLLNAVPVYAWLGAPRVMPAADAGAAIASAVNKRPVRVAAANLFWRSDEYADVRRWARASGGDVLVFVEVSARWERELAPLRDRWPHAVFALKPGHSGTLVLSRWPLREEGVLSVHSRGTPDPVLAVAMPGAVWRLVPVHANWPMGRLASAYRATDLEGLAAVAARSDRPLLAIGDFNLSPLSPHFAALLRDGRLRNAAAGRGWQPTWPVFLPFMGIQIDHALTSPDIAVNSFVAGAIKGSDHRPIVVDLGIPARETAE